MSPRQPSGMITFPETTSLTLNIDIIDGWKMNFLLGNPSFRCKLLLQGGIVNPPWSLFSEVLGGIWVGLAPSDSHDPAPLKEGRGYKASMGNLHWRFQEVFNPKRYSCWPHFSTQDLFRNCLQFQNFISNHQNTKKKTKQINPSNKSHLFSFYAGTRMLLLFQAPTSLSVRKTPKCGRRAKPLRTNLGSMGTIRRTDGYSRPCS